MILNMAIENLEFYGTISFYLFAGLGLLVFIVNGIIRDNANYVVKGFINSIISITLILIFLIAFVIDYNSNKLSTFGVYPYIYLASLSLLYGLIFGLANIIKGKKRFQSLSRNKIRPSINRNINQYVYVIFKHNNEVILDKVKDEYKGFVVKMDKGHLFKDEIIKTLLSLYNVKLKDDEIDEMGVCTINGKRPDIYYCYLIEIDEISDSLKEKQIVDSFDIIALNMQDNDKKMVLRILLREKFNIYL